jgi:hypothetical protein
MTGLLSVYVDEYAGLHQASGSTVRYGNWRDFRLSFPQSCAVLPESGERAAVALTSAGTAQTQSVMAGVSEIAQSF